MRMPVAVVLAVVCVLIVPSNGQHSLGSGGNDYVYGWAFEAKGTEDVFASATVIAADGGIYMAGIVHGELTLVAGDSYTLHGDAETNATFYGDVFVARFTAAGDLMWAVQSSSKNGPGSTVDDLEADGDGNIYLAGSFQGDVTWKVGGGGDVTLVAPGGAGTDDGYFVKFDGSGTVLYAEQLGSVSFEGPADLAVTLSFSETAATATTTTTTTGASSKEATLLFTGTFSGNITTGNVSLSSVGAYNLVMMSYDLDTADPIWGIQSYGAVLTSGGVEYSHQTSTALVAGGLVGCVKWTPDGDAQCVTQGLFIARYNVDNGAWLEGEVVETNSIRGTVRLAVDLLGDNVYVSGPFSGTVHFGFFQLTADGPVDMFVAKYTDLASVTWAKAVGSSSYDEPLGLAYDYGYNGPILVGGVSGEAYIDHLKVNVTDAVLMARFEETSGDLAWNFAVSGITSHVAVACKPGASGIFLVGGFIGPLMVAPGHSFRSTFLSVFGAMYVPGATTTPGPTTVSPNHRLTPSKRATVGVLLALTVVLGVGIGGGVYWWRKRRGKGGRSRTDYAPGAAAGSPARYARLGSDRPSAASTQRSYGTTADA